MIEIATLGAGCFWCVEAVFTSLPGIINVEVGYCNGEEKEPTYKMICEGNSSHVEATQISFNPNIISFKEILNHFFSTHDPTTLDKQGADTGTQYRSGIYYHNDKQKEIAIKTLQEWDNKNIYINPIVTEIFPVNNYHKAEDYHQDYYKNNPSAPYCMFVIKPKLDKLSK